MNLNREKFWLVWCDDGRTPVVRHYDAQKAQTEAERLAKEHAGKRFFVLEAQTVSVRADALTFDLTVTEIPW